MIDPHPGLTRRSFSLLAVGTALAACSSGAESTTTTPSVPTTPASSATGSEPTTSTTETATSEVTSTVPVPLGPTMPLTGLPVPDGVPGIAQRPALVVKMDNHPDARPQSGLNTADIVFEENVEQLTRFAAVFHSSGANPVGPIRSGRTQDIALLGSLNRPLFAWSGGNPRVTSAIVASDLRQFSEQQGKFGFFRTTDRAKPHNLYNTTDALFALAPDDAGPPPPQFSYRSPSDAIGGDDVAGVKISMDGVRVLWTWDVNVAAFVRRSDDVEHFDQLDGLQINSQNIVICFVNYVASAADSRSPEAQTIGSGEVWALSGGKLIQGQWTRPDRLVPFGLTDQAGAPILLGPGRTWVELVRAGKAASIPASATVDSVTYP